MDNKQIQSIIFDQSRSAMQRGRHISFRMKFYSMDEGERTRYLISIMDKILESGIGMDLWEVMGYPNTYDAMKVVYNGILKLAGGDENDAIKEFEIFIHDYLTIKRLKQMVNLKAKKVRPELQSYFIDITDPVIPKITKEYLGKQPSVIVRMIFALGELNKIHNPHGPDGILSDEYGVKMGTFEMLKNELQLKGTYQAFYAQVSYYSVTNHKEIAKEIAKESEKILRL